MMIAEKFECFECDRLVTPRIETRSEVLPVRGEDTEVSARVGICPECGADMSIEELDDAALIAAFDTYRVKHGLMTPAEMRHLREKYGLGVRAFSLLLGWGEITMHRYEAGSLQDAAHEAALRLAQTPANIHVYLKANGHKLTARQRARAEAHLRAIEADQRVCSPIAEDRFVVREERDSYGGWVPMQLSKMREMMLVFAALPEMYQTKLNKLLYYADFLFFRDNGVSITGSPYLAMQFGPVPQHYPWIEADLVEGGDLAAEEVFFRNGGSGVVLSAGRPADVSVFSPEELAVIRRVASELGGQTSKQLSARSHKERAWLETPKGAMISYETAEGLSL